MTPKTARGPVRWWLRLTGFGGICLPPFGIYVLAERLGNERLIRHELAHWRQYERLGFLGFYVTYLWYTIRHGYWNNPMEVEARGAENG